MKDFSVVGKPVARQDAYDKVTGTALYADDYSFHGMLFGVMVRVPATHATIDKIEYSPELLNNKNVTAICDANDCPAAKKVGPIKQDQPIFSFEKILTPGDVVAMLVGPHEEELIKLRSEVKVSFTPLPALTDPLKALEADAPLIHPAYKNNEINYYPLRKGDVEKGLAESDFILDQTYTTQIIEHAYLETEAVIAIPMGKERGVKIIGSIQNPHTTRKVVASVLGLPLTKVRVIQAELGGSFGGKDDTMNIISARAAVAAVKTGKPVKIRFNREDSILESYKRHPYYMHYKVGYMKDGTLKAMKIDIVADGGCYSSMSPFVTWRTVVQATGPYVVEHAWTDVRAVYTNNPYTGAMRGFGSPQPIFAQESIMDEIAAKLGMSPIEIRRKNGFKSGSITASSQKLENHDINLMSVMDAAEKEAGFEAKWIENEKINAEAAKLLGGFNASENKSYIFDKDELIDPEKSKRKGIGLACSFRGCALGAEGVDAAAAYISVQIDGSVYLISGLAENGQGLHATFSIVAAEVLGVDISDIYYLDHDTSVVPDSGPTVASRSTLMGGGAVKDGADIIRSRMEKVLCEEWKLPENTKFSFAHHVVKTEDGKHSMTFKDVCALCNSKAVSLATVGWYKGPKVHWDEELGQGPAYFTYVYGCQVAEVTVDLATGLVSVDRVVAVHDAGTIINRLGAIGQIYGGVTQGVGYGLWEEISTHQGKIRELNFDQYLIPTSKEIKEITPIFIEGKEIYGPWGAKSLGEPTLELGAAAVANAVRNATGIRFHNLPINLEELLLRRKLYPEDLKRGSL
jgi:CO/xanthine dehydrogenase Mo-binding subunit